MQAFLGLAAGALIYYVAAVAWAVLTVGGLGTGLLSTIAISILSGLSVFVGWRWSIVGLTAGIFILMFVLFAGLTGISSGPPASLWEDVPGVLGYGAASGYPSIVGVVLVCSSIVRRLPAPRN
ncbi:hypothetical protein E3T55_08165 [Cryobacterium frigoriphilum]|uniref:Uncharacterized protein n=1 Tax=Cryobacterium frigoriphilum TaxID=1259150 RepID=A0A4R9A2T0_9MICO|nr:hypothetical protein [Cryobacterium frigoriphilum]TFD51014.1 hypothetical protein E3T55_08165 [Cryobacterium frigoriphilum]